MNLKEKREAALKSARDIAEKAKSEGRDLAPGETRQIEAKLAEADELKSEIARRTKGDELLARTAGHGPIGGDGVNHLALGGHAAKSLARTIVEKSAEGRDVRSKAVVSAGTAVTAQPLLDGVAAEGRRVESLFNLIPAAEREAPVYSYMRQNSRTNAAATVARGALKPTSVYGIERIDATLQVFAHLSEPIDEYIQTDNANIARFLAAELTYGLGLALEDQVVNGDGVGTNLTGLLNTSGVQTQAVLSDPVTTLRGAATALETLGHAVGGYALNPLDWETIETTRNASGNFDLNGPVDRAARTVWGSPVVTTTALAQGTALALDPTALSVDHGPEGIQVKWGTSGDDFDRNQLRARVEGRFGLAVYQPAGVVIADLGTAPV